MSNNETTVVVFSGSKGDNKDHVQLASILGRLIAQNSMILANGGGPGLMKEVAHSAHLEGGKTIGVHFTYEGRKLEEFYSQSYVFDELVPRQEKLIELGDHFIALPGGIGTIYETIELIAFKHVGKIPREKKVILVDRGVWHSFNEMVSQSIEGGYVSDDIKTHYIIVNTAEEAMEEIKKK